MPAAHVQQRAAVSVGTDDLLDLGPRHKADFVLGIDRLEVLLPGAQGFFLAGVEAHVAIAVAEVCVDRVLGDAILDDASTQLADFKDLAQPLLAHLLLDFLQVVADPRHDLATVAARAAEAQVAGFQHHDIGDAFFGEFECGIDPRKATANHHDIRFHVLLECGEAEVVFLGRRIIGRRFNIDHGAAWKSERKLAAEPTRGSVPLRCY